MEKTVKILTSFFIAFVCSSVACAGIFSNSLQSGGESAAVGTPKASTIFRQNIGAATPVQWARQLPGTANSETFLSSQVWQTTRTDILQTYGNNAQVNQYLDYQEYLFRKAIRINNKAGFRSLDIKGNLAESIMDDFYIKDGWEVIDGKRGRNGLDGLYVRRNKNGIITDWIAADAKSGTSKLNMTNRGMQLSPEWVERNLKDLLTMAENEYRNTPSAATKQRVADLKQIMKIPGRKPRVFTMKLVSNGGKIQYRLENIGVDGKTIGKTIFVDMNAANRGEMLRMKRMIYRDLEKHISVYDSKGAAVLVEKIEKGFNKGIVKSDSDLFRLIKREIPDKKLAMAVTQELGEKPLRGSLAGAVGKNISKNSGMIISATVVAGFIIAHDSMRNGITEETFLKAGAMSTGMAATGVASDYAMKFVVTHTSKHVAKYMLGRTGKNITERAVAKIAEKLAPTIGRSIGGGLQVAFALYFVGDTIYRYNQGQITQTDMWVNVSIIALTTAGTVFFTCTTGGAKVGAAIGSLFGPAGTAAGGTIGATIGVVIGFVGGVATGGYTWYTENKRQENLLIEARWRAKLETENNRMRLKQTISELKKKAEQMQNEAWGRLLPAM